MLTVYLLATLLRCCDSPSPQPLGQQLQLLRLFRPPRSRRRSAATDDQLSRNATVVASH